MFSEGLKGYLAKGSLPMLDSKDANLWEELIGLLEKNPVKTTQAVKDLLELKENARFSQGSFLDQSIVVNKIPIMLTADEAARFFGFINARLTANHTIATHPQSPVRNYIARLRAVALKCNLIPQSDVSLAPVDGHHGMGTGLSTTGSLTYLPDPSLPLPTGQGSKPDYDVIGRLAPMLKVLQRRNYQDRSGILGAKPHYVLAHLINHNVNGSGSDPANVVPFWATANTEMSNKVEKHLKELVLSGVQVKYSIVSGPAVGMTPGRTKAFSACAGVAALEEIVTAEQYLPAYLTLTVQGLDATKNAWVTVVNATPIMNFVPETAPVLYS